MGESTYGYGREVRTLVDVARLPFDIGMRAAETGAAMFSPSRGEGMAGVSEAVYDPYAVNQREQLRGVLERTPELRQQMQAAQGGDAESAMIALRSLTDLAAKAPYHGMDREMFKPAIQEMWRASMVRNDPSQPGGAVRAFQGGAAVADTPAQMGAAARFAPFAAATERETALQPGRLEKQGLEYRAAQAEEEREAKAFPTKQAYTEALTRQMNVSAAEGEKRLPFVTGEELEKRRSRKLERDAERRRQHLDDIYGKREREARIGMMERSAGGGGGGDLNPDQILRDLYPEDYVDRGGTDGPPGDGPLSYEQAMDLISNARTPAEFLDEPVLAKLDPASTEPLDSAEVIESLRRRKIEDPRIFKMVWEMIQAGHVFNRYGVPLVPGRQAPRQ